LFDFTIQPSNDMHAHKLLKHAHVHSHKDNNSVISQFFKYYN